MGSPLVGEVHKEPRRRKPYGAPSLHDVPPVRANRTGKGEGEASIGGWRAEHGRLIYVDEHRTSSLLDQLHLIGTWASHRPLRDLAPERPWSSMGKVAAAATNRKAIDLVDWCDVIVPDGFHPGQALSIVGRVGRAEDVTPVGFPLDVGGALINVVVDKEYALHLNQAYLVQRSLLIIGRVNSVPRRQVRAVAIASSAVG